MASCPQCSGDVELGAPHACSQVTVLTRAPSAAVDPLLGRVLGGQYRLLEKIGEGGFGAVYLAEHVHLKKHFAAKILRGDAARADDAIRRFEIEAIAASKLDHDNIIDVVHFGRADDGVAYLVMEYLRGETLAQRIARGALAFADAVTVGAQICRALQAAHGAGVVHRDLKPGNVFLAQRGGRVTVKLLDFGVCRMIDDDRADARMTRAGQLLGTPLYMAPEALSEDGELDARADVYALGVILYEMVTGAPPFLARDYLQVLRMHASTPPRPPSGARPDVPPQLERVILDALEKDPAARHQTAAHLEADLLAALPGAADSSLRLSAPSTRLEATISSRLEPEPAAPATRPPTNLLAPPTRFVGRPRELGEVVDLLRSARLVTLTGAGGAGKTRLAAEVGARVRDRFEDGVWLVELAALRDGEQLADAVARALSVDTRSGAALTALIGALATKRALLLLDNCEHVVGAAAALVEALLAAAPGLAVLTTSRERLCIAGETTYRVPPLSLPDARTEASAADVAACDAVRFFVDRARAAQAGFELTAANATAVANICRRLDGMPLALELAAARLRSLSIAELQERLGDCFRVLTGGSRTAMPRQQTLRALIDWSHDLLTHEQRVLLRRLAAFRGAFSLAEVEAVAADDVLAADALLDVLDALVDRSIVVADTRGRATRYRLLEVMRQYARKKLDEAGEVDALRLRHRDALLARAEELCAQLGASADDAAWFDALAADHDDLREAIETSLALEASGQAPAAHRFVTALRRYWLVRGHYVEARAYLSRMLELHTAPEVPRLVALDAAVTFATMQRDYAAAVAHEREAIAIARRLGERVRESTLKTHLAWLHYLRCGFREADAHADEALAFARSIDAPGFSLVFALNIAGMAASTVHDHARAIALLEECVALTESSGGRQYHANVLESLASAYARSDGHYERALPLYRTCAAFFVQVGDKNGALCLCERMAEVATDRGRVLDAARLLGAADAAREALGAKREPIAEHELAPARAAIDAQLTDAERTAAHRDGRALPWDHVMSLALSIV